MKQPRYKIPEGRVTVAAVDEEVEDKVVEREVVIVLPTVKAGLAVAVLVMSTPPQTPVL
jgi:hypothetical protein